MTTVGNDLRNRAFGQEHTLSVVDHFGLWLSARRMRRDAGGFAGRRIADIGSGYHAAFARTLVGTAARITLVDLALHPALRDEPGVEVLEGRLPDVLELIPDRSHDVVMCNSVIEHLWEPEVTVRHLRRMTAPGGTVLINVPSWRGKMFLELSAFRLGLSPSDEMDDHKMYYDPRDLWPLLVRAGFVPRDIECRRHKFGLNTFARCRMPHE